MEETMTKAQKQAIALESYIKMTSSLPSYAVYCKWCDKKDKALFTAQTFSRYYWKARNVDAKSKEGKELIKQYKDIKEGDIDLDTVAVKPDGIYGRKFGEKELTSLYALGNTKTVSGNILAKDAKTSLILAKDFIVDFDLPVARKMHVYVSKEGAHIRYCDGYLREAYKNKRKFCIEVFRY